MTLKEYMQYKERNKKLPQISMGEKVQNMLKFYLSMNFGVPESELTQTITTGIERDVETFNFESSDDESDEEKT